MINMKTYWTMDPDKKIQRDDLGKSAMRNDVPPEGQLVLLLPAKIPGNLFVERIPLIRWNKKALGRLELKPHKKNMIKALVIIPLYRVTSGDIGTDADEVEKYLDKADVFFEERTATDLQRNTLVSIFLRVLEYYEGILILTTNRVGTFDEVFKSRIKPAMHYPALNHQSRRATWRSLIYHAKGSPDVDLDELEGKFDDSAREALDGRQITYTYTTARGLAQYRKQKLSASHIDHAIEVAKEFEEYVTKIHGQPDEEWARK
ncbi:hypothetical protein K469DRAFT_722458 [Zopfia rhizophila CBS 207.26]|uniref:ATPase AAA-type core domain-containing protein n=1 Tax=Zopfia rhizophila CBS 207.26 TaxID=1314779 RepID=A0A6A6EWL2_9PEZI|nr:hypothetical protein K469DRAFT_722458 [Zopfia rhizophila CBS 207.26]